MPIIAHHCQSMPSVPYSLIKHNILILVVSFPIFGCFPTSQPNLCFASKLFTPHWHVQICEIRKSFSIRGSILTTSDHKCDDWFTVQHQLQPFTAHEWVHFGCRLWRTAPTFTTGSSTLAPARTLQRAAESSASSGASATFKPPGMDGWQVKAPGVGAGDGWDMLGLGESCLELALIPFPSLAVHFSPVSTLRGSYGRG